MPHPSGAVAQHNNNYIFPGTRPTRDQAFARTVGISSLHSVAVREPPKKFVGIFKFARAPIRIPENKLGKADNGTDRRIRVSGARDDREVASAGILSRERQTIRIHKVRVHSSQLRSATIHDLGKSLDGPRVVAREASRNVVRTLHQQSP